MKIKPTVPSTGFSTNFLKGIQPPEVNEDPFIVYDNRDGLGIKVSSTGTKTFVKTYRFGDKTKLLTLGRFPAFSLSEARAMVEESKLMLDRGLDPMVQFKIKKSKTIISVERTFGGLADQFLEYKKDKIANLTWNDYKDCLYNYIFQSKKSPRKDGRPYTGNVYTDWSEYPVEDLTRDDIRSIFKSITDNGIGRRANMTNDALKGVFAYCIQEKGLNLTALTTIADPHLEKMSTRYLGEDEIGIFWHGLLHLNSAQSVLALRLILLLGRRETEVLGAQWSEFDLDRKEWFIPAKRNQDGEIVSSGLKIHRSNQHLVGGLMIPLPDLAVKMIKEYKASLPTKLIHVFAREFNLLIPPDRRSLSRPLRAAIEKMGLKEAIKPSDLRRTAKTHLSRLGIPTEISNRITAHTVGEKIERTYDKYDKLKEKRQALEIWANEITRLIATKNIQEV